MSVWVIGGRELINLLCPLWRRHIALGTRPQSSDDDGPAHLLGLCVSLKTPRFFLVTHRQAGTQRH